MKTKWKTWSKWQKTNFGLFVSVIFVLLLGLIIIGATTVTETMKSNHGSDINETISVTGFNFLSDNSISNIWKLFDGTTQMEIPTLQGPIICSVAVTGVATLKTGIVFAVILTPILAATTIGSLGYYFYKHQKQQQN